MASKAQITIIVPVFNEMNSILAFLETTDKVVGRTRNVSVRYLFVNDGSTDDTLGTLLTVANIRDDIDVLELSRNFGKEAALSAGIDIAEGDAVIPIDVDLQDPPELIPEMIDLWRSGYDVVLARRTDRLSDSWMKRGSSYLFYKLHNLIAHQKLPENVGDFRLMNRMVVDVVSKLPETQRFMKGLFVWAGFKTVIIDYKRPNRLTGDSRFNGWQLWNLALEGFTSFSTWPLRVWSYFGFFAALISFCLAFVIVIQKLALGIDVPGYASIMVIIALFGGFQMLGIGILGEYLGRTYLETKRRPVYVIRRFHASGKR